MNSKKRKQQAAERIIVGISLAIIAYSATKLNNQYNKKIQENDENLAKIKQTENIFIANVMEELTRRVKEAVMTDDDRYKIIMNNNLSKELHEGIMLKYPTAGLYVEEKLREVRATGYKIK